MCFFFSFALLICALAQRRQQPQWQCIKQINEADKCSTCYCLYLTQLFRYVDIAQRAVGVCNVIAKCVRIIFLWYFSLMSIFCHVAIITSQRRFFFRWFFPRHSRCMFFFSLSLHVGFAYFIVSCGSGSYRWRCVCILVLVLICWFLLVVLHHKLPFANFLSIKCKQQSEFMCF